jgi:curved DNA-binding protein
VSSKNRQPKKIVDGLIMEFKDYYKILAVAEDADNKVIKTAYRKLARKYHPDVSEHNEAEEKFKEVTEAYEVLKNPEKRAQYDEYRKFGGRSSGRQDGSSQYTEGASGYGDFSEFFSSIFGGADPRGNEQREGYGFTSQQSFNQRGQDIETDMPIFLEDTLADASKTIFYRLPHRDAEGHVSEINRTLNVKIPAGVVNGERIRLKGQGGQGVGGALNGDLYLRIRMVPHPLFDVEAHNLIITVPLAPWEAALGATVEVPTLLGKINLTIPANSQTGQRLRVKGKGLVGKQGQGDLYALLKVVMPSSTNDDIEKQWQQLASSAAFNPRKEWSK